MTWPFWKKKEPIQKSPPEDVGGVRNLHERLAQIPVGYGFLLPTRDGFKEFKCVGTRSYPERKK